MKEALNVNVSLGLRGNERLRFLATMKGIDPQDPRALGDLLTPLIEAETAIVLARVNAAQPTRAEAEGGKP
jgi:hypothetical protein